MCQFPYRCLRQALASFSGPLHLNIPQSPSTFIQAAYPTFPPISVQLVFVTCNFLTTLCSGLSLCDELGLLSDLGLWIVIKYRHGPNMQCRLSGDDASTNLGLSSTTMYICISAHLHHVATHHIALKEHTTGLLFVLCM